MTESNIFKQIEEMIYKDVDKAKKMLFNAMNNKILSNMDTTDLLVKLGAELWAKDRTTKAKEILSIASRYAEDNDYKADALKYIAHCYQDENNYEEAMKVYKQILSLTKDKYLIASAYQGMGDIFFELDKMKESLNYYLKSLDYFDADRPELWDGIEISVVRVVNLYLYFGDKNNADIYINRLLNDSKTTSYALERIYYNLAHYYYRREDWPRALENYKLALSYFDKKDHDILADMYSYIADCYYRQSFFDEAKKWYLKSLEFTNKEDKERLKHRKDSIKYINEITKKTEH